MSRLKLGFIGTGKMASAIIGGTLSQKLVPANQIGIFDVNSESMQSFSEKGCQAFRGIFELVNGCEKVVVAVKPQSFPAVLPEIKQGMNKDTLLVSIAAGITADYIKEQIGFDCKIILVMPNTPLLLGHGATALSRVEPATVEEFQQVKSLFAAAGIAEEIDVELMNEIIPVNGSSPAFIYLFAKVIIEKSVKAGIDREAALRLISQTLIGSAYMLTESGQSPQQLIDAVCSPGGTTLAALDALEEHGFPKAVEKAFDACVNRARELAQATGASQEDEVYPDYGKITVKTITLGSNEYKKAFALRDAVMRRPLGMKLEEDAEQESMYVHIAALERNSVVGTLLLQRIDPDTVRVRQVAVCPDFRNRGIGTKLMRYAEGYSRGIGVKRITLHARKTAEAFYNKTGYDSVGKEFMEISIPHIKMEKEMQ